MSDTIIETQGLTKVFGETVAVDALGLTVPKGAIFGFLGPNGAGKTTAIRMLMGHLHPTHGTVRLLGANPWQLDATDRQRVAYVSEDMNLPSWMTPQAAVRYNAAFYPRWDAARAEALLDRFDLRTAGRFKTLSKGQKRRVCLLLALCANAEVLVLDEPGAGLDVAARRDLLDEILEHVYDGERTVFFSSHLLSDLERVVDRIAILKKGRLCLTGELEALKDGVRRIELPREVSREAVAEHFSVLAYQADGDETAATVLDFDEGRFEDFCAAHGGGAGARVQGFNLEDLFVELVRDKGEPAP